MKFSVAATLLLGSAFGSSSVMVIALPLPPLPAPFAVPPLPPLPAPFSAPFFPTPAPSIPDLSCEGNCGGTTGNCWCDSLCVGFGDCCSDACGVCGQCPAPTPTPSDAPSDVPSGSPSKYNVILGIESQSMRKTIPLTRTRFTFLPLQQPWLRLFQTTLGSLTRPRSIWWLRKPRWTFRTKSVNRVKTLIILPQPSFRGALTKLRKAWAFIFGTSISATM